MWEYLQDAPMQKKHFNTPWHTYWGRFMERLGRRALRDHMTDEYLQSLYPEVEVVSSNRMNPYGFGKKSGKIFRGKAAAMKQVDSLWILHCKNGEEFGKRAVAVEIKSGVSSINKEHCDFWRHLIAEPQEYIPKCTHLRLFIMWIYGLDLETRTLFYSIKEIIPDEFPSQRV